MRDGSLTTGQAVTDAAIELFTICHQSSAEYSGYVSQSRSEGIRQFEVGQSGFFLLIRCDFRERS